jgi:hypothetical protein
MKLAQDYFWPYINSSGLILKAAVSATMKLVCHLFYEVIPPTSKLTAGRAHDIFLSSLWPNGAWIKLRTRLNL